MQSFTGLSVSDEKPVKAVYSTGFTAYMKLGNFSVLHKRNSKDQAEYAGVTSWIIEIRVPVTMKNI